MKFDECIRASLTSMYLKFYADTSLIHVSDKLMCLMTHYGMSLRNVLRVSAFCLMNVS